MTLTIRRLLFVALPSIAGFFGIIFVWKKRKTPPRLKDSDCQSSGNKSEKVNCNVVHTPVGPRVDIKIVSEDSDKSSSCDSDTNQSNLLEGEPRKCLSNSLVGADHSDGQQADHQADVTETLDTAKRNVAVTQVSPCPTDESTIKGGSSKASSCNNNVYQKPNLAAGDSGAVYGGMCTVSRETLDGDTITGCNKTRDAEHSSQLQNGFPEGSPVKETVSSKVSNACLSSSPCQRQIPRSPTKARSAHKTNQPPQLSQSPSHQNNGVHEEECTQSHTAKLGHDQPSNGQHDLPNVEVEVSMVTEGATCEDPHKAPMTPSSIGSPIENGSISSSSGSCSDSHSELSADSGRGGSLPKPKMKVEVISYEFDFPSDMCGLLIGTKGRQINWIKNMSGAEISVRRKMTTQDYQLVVLEGTKRRVDHALRLIKQKFPPAMYHDIDYTPAMPEMPPPPPQITPDMLQLCLPDDCAIEVMVSSVVAPNHIFVQQPTHPTWPNLDRQRHFMMMCYAGDNAVPQLPRPLEVGTICAAPMYDSWYRAQIVCVYPDHDECDIKFVDYGGYVKSQGCDLRQIRTDFTTLPFQAIECYLANVVPPKDMDTFPTEALHLTQQLVEGMLLQAEVAGRDMEDGTPYIHLYNMQGNHVIEINRELVNRGVARWLEH